MKIKGTDPSGHEQVYYRYERVEKFMGDKVLPPIFEGGMIVTGGVIGDDAVPLPWREFAERLLMERPFPDEHDRLLWAPEEQ